MSVPLVMAATAAGMGAPAYAAGKEHQASAKAGARRVHPRILRIGDTGPDVVRLQRALGVAPDGIFGRHTLHAVLLFQRGHHLLADGQVGQHTRAALQGATGAAGEVVIRVHDRGPAVAALQRALGVTADGEFGPITLHAVKALPGSPRIAGGRPGGPEHAGGDGPGGQQQLRPRRAGRHRQRPSPPPSGRSAAHPWQPDRGAPARRRPGRRRHPAGAWGHRRRRVRGGHAARGEGLPGSPRLAGGRPGGREHAGRPAAAGQQRLPPSLRRLGQRRRTTTIVTIARARAAGSGRERWRWP